MQPTPYTPTESFGDSERNNAGGRSTVRTAMLDAELSAVSTSVNELITNIGLIQRDDGKLRDAIVEPYHLSAATKAYALATKWNARGLWATAQVYAVNDMVEVSGASYICAIAHTSGVFATDRAAGRWQIFTSANTASSVSFSSTPEIAAMDVQAAIVEVDTRSRNASLPMLSAFYGGF